MIKKCCLNTTVNKVKKSLKTLILIFLPILIFSCSSTKEQDQDIIVKKNTEINAEKRARAAADSNPLFSSNRMAKSGGNFEFSTSNILWRASLESLEDIPLITVDYSGGVILTDWYTIAGTADLARDVKIQVRFLSSEISSSSIKVTGHIKECTSFNRCKITKTSDSLNDEMKTKIINKARGININREKLKK